MTPRGTKGAETIRLALAGVSRDEIARRLGTTRRAIIVVLSRARRRGVAVPYEPDGPRPFRRDAVRAMVAERLTPEAMARRLGISEQNVRVQLAKLRRAEGLDIPYRRPPSPAFRAAMARRSEARA